MKKRNKWTCRNEESKSDRRAFQSEEGRLGLKTKKALCCFVSFAIAERREGLTAHDRGMRQGRTGVRGGWKIQHASPGEFGYFSEYSRYQLCTYDSAPKKVTPPCCLRAPYDLCTPTEPVRYCTTVLCPETRQWVPHCSSTDRPTSEPGVCRKLNACA